MKRMKILATLLATIAFALPAAAQYDETAKSFHLLPHLADGGGWQSILLVTNVSIVPSHCTFNVYGMPLNRFRDASGITTAGSTATFQMAGPGGYLIWPTKSESALASGYATLDCSAPVVAQVVFASIDGLGVVTGMATVFSSQAATIFQFPVLRPAATLGFAIANDTNAEASCRVLLVDPQGTPLGEAMLSVPAKSNLSQLLNTAISIPGTFRGGTATVSCNQQVAVIGLHFELRPDGTIITFTTLPPAILSTTPVSIPTPTSFAPVDQAAFDSLAVGKQLVYDANNQLIFFAAGRILAIENGISSSGNYRYTRTGPSTGTVAYTYDRTGNNPNVERSEIRATFTSAAAGTYNYAYISGGVTLLTGRGVFDLNAGTYTPILE